MPMYLLQKNQPNPNWWVTTLIWHGMTLSRKHITYLSINSCFSLFHLNPNLFFLLHPPFSAHSWHTCHDNIHLSKSPISNQPTEANIHESLYGHRYNFLFWEWNTLRFACHYNNITKMQYFIPENIHITCIIDKLKTSPSPSPDIPQRSDLFWHLGPVVQGLVSATLG